MHKFEIIESKDFSKTNKIRNFSFTFLIVIIVAIRLLTLFEKDSNIQPLIDNIALGVLFIMVLLAIIIIRSFIIMHNNKKTGTIQFLKDNIKVVDNKGYVEIQYDNIKQFNILHFNSENFKTDIIAGTKRLKLIIKEITEKEFNFEIKIKSHYESLQLQKAIQKINSDKIEI